MKDTAQYYPNVKLYRIKKGINQSEAANHLNINVNSYSKKESGKREFTISEGIKLAKLFKVNLTMMFEIKI